MHKMSMDLQRKTEKKTKNEYIEGKYIFLYMDTVTVQTEPSAKFKSRFKGDSRLFCNYCEVCKGRIDKERTDCYTSSQLFRDNCSDIRSNSHVSESQISIPLCLIRKQRDPDGCILSGDRLQEEKNDSI